MLRSPHAIRVVDAIVLVFVASRSVTQHQPPHVVLVNTAPEDACMLSVGVSASMCHVSMRLLPKLVPRAPCNNLTATSGYNPPHQQNIFSLFFFPQPRRPGFNNPKTDLITDGENGFWVSFP